MCSVAADPQPLSRVERKPIAPPAAAPSRRKGHHGWFRLSKPTSASYGKRISTLAVHDRASVRASQAKAAKKCEHRIDTQSRVRSSGRRSRLGWNCLCAGV